ncbi:MAG: hypothetical protein JJV93_02680 [Alphaproteobacteria bacterium]|nr:hypothetical protein [Alphaproteobacteria bacterium]MBL0718135.1 hypothetical protein [Alphaproteobacteria bacterium]
MLSNGDNNFSEYLEIWRGQGLEVSMKSYSDGIYFLLKDPMCTPEVFTNIFDMLFLVSQIIAGLLFFGWAVGLIIKNISIRGDQNPPKIIDSIKHLFFVFLIFTALNPIVKFATGMSVDEIKCQSFLIKADQVDNYLPNLPKL